MDLSAIDWNSWAALLVASCVILVGVFTTILPVVPGTLIVFCGVLLHRVWMGEGASISWTFVMVALSLVVVSQVLDIALGAWGAKRFGASWKGALGAAIGGIVGMALGIFGMLLGTFAGALLFEYIEVRDHCRATRAGVGTLVGTILAMIAKLAISVSLAFAFYFYMPAWPWS